jgi:indole-3-glycerol phosphate synthase
VEAGERVVSILDEILAKKRDELALLRRHMRGRQPRSLEQALRRTVGEPVRVIAEIKRASPSAGPIRPGADPVAIALDYATAGAAAISVLTDKTFFDGDLAFLWPCRDAVPLPILRKDFLVDGLQIQESRYFGADAVLLIVAAVDRMDVMLGHVESQDLEALVEVHTIDEAGVALDAGARILGVNHRDLHTFAIDMSLTEQIAKRVPSDVVLVAESGIRTRDDIRRLGDAGAHAVLVGEHLMRAPSPGDALRELLR